MGPTPRGQAPRVQLPEVQLPGSSSQRSSCQGPAPKVQLPGSSSHGSSSQGPSIHLSTIPIPPEAPILDGLHLLRFPPSGPLSLSPPEVSATASVRAVPRLRCSSTSGPSPARTAASPPCPSAPGKSVSLRTAAVRSHTGSRDRKL